MLSEGDYAAACALQPGLAEAYFCLAEQKMSLAAATVNELNAQLLRLAAVQHAALAIQYNAHDLRYHALCLALATAVRDPAMIDHYTTQITALTQQESACQTLYPEAYLTYPTPFAIAPTTPRVAADLYWAQQMTSDVKMVTYLYENIALSEPQEIVSRYKLAKLLVLRDQNWVAVTQYLEKSRIALFHLTLAQVMYAEVISQDPDAPPNHLLKILVRSIVSRALLEATDADYIWLHDFKPLMLAILTDIPLRPSTDTSPKARGNAMLLAEAKDYLRDMKTERALQLFLAVLVAQPHAFIEFQFIAECYNAQHEPVNANLYYSLALMQTSREDPNNHERLITLHNLRALMYFKQKLPNHAYREIARVTRMLCEHELTIPELPQFYFTQGKNLPPDAPHYEACHWFNMLQFLTTDAKFYFDSGKALFRRGALTQALFFFQDALIFWHYAASTSPTTKMHYAQYFNDTLLYVVLTDEKFSAQVLLTPKDAVSSPDIDRELAKNHQAAQQMLLMKSCNNIVELCRRQAAAAFALDNFALAIHYYDYILKQYPQDYITEQHRSVAYYSSRRYADAFAGLNSIIERTAYPRALFLRGIILYNNHDNKAAAYLDIRLALVTLCRADHPYFKGFDLPEEAWSYINNIAKTTARLSFLEQEEGLVKAQQHYQLEQWPAALAGLLKIISAGFCTAEGYALLAEVYHQLDKTASALMALSTAYVLASPQQAVIHWQRRKELFPLPDLGAYLTTAPDASTSFTEVKTHGNGITKLGGAPKVKASKRAKRNPTLFRFPVTTPVSAPSAEEMEVAATFKDSASPAPLLTQDALSVALAVTSLPMLTPVLATDVVAESTLAAEFAPAGLNAAEIPFAVNPASNAKPAIAPTVTLSTTASLQVTLAAAISSDNIVSAGPADLVVTTTPPPQPVIALQNNCNSDSLILAAPLGTANLTDEGVTLHPEPAAQPAANPPDWLINLVPTRIELPTVVSSVFAALQNLQTNAADTNAPLTYLTGGAVLHLIFKQCHENFLLWQNAPHAGDITAFIATVKKDLTAAATSLDPYLHFVTEAPVKVCQAALVTLFPTAQHQSGGGASQCWVTTPGGQVIVLESCANLSDYIDVLGLPYADCTGALLNLHRARLITRQFAPIPHLDQTQHRYSWEALACAVNYQYDLNSFADWLKPLTLLVSQLAQQASQQAAVVKEINFYLAKLFAGNRPKAIFRKLKKAGVLDLLIGPLARVHLSQDKSLSARIGGITQLSAPRLPTVLAYLAVSLLHTRRASNGVLSVVDFIQFIDRTPLYKPLFTDLEDISALFKLTHHEWLVDHAPRATENRVSLKN